MAKFMLSVGDETARLLAIEARKRDLNVQQLLRAIILPEWARENLEMIPTRPAFRDMAASMLRPQVYGRKQESPLLQMSRDRIRR